MKELRPEAAWLFPTIQTLIDLKDLIGEAVKGHAVPPWAGLMFLMIYSAPGITQQELADWSGISKFAVSRVVRAYESLGMVESERVGRDKQLHLSRRAEQLGRTLAMRNKALIRKAALARQ